MIHKCIEKSISIVHRVIPHRCSTFHHRHRLLEDGCRLPDRRYQRVVHRRGHWRGRRGRRGRRGLFHFVRRSVLRFSGRVVLVLLLLLLVLLDGSLLLLLLLLLHRPQKHGVDLASLGKGSGITRCSSKSIVIRASY